jgi:hypothetical protein
VLNNDKYDCSLENPRKKVAVPKAARHVERQALHGEQQARLGAKCKIDDYKDDSKTSNMENRLAVQKAERTRQGSGDDQYGR